MCGSAKHLSEQSYGEDIVCCFITVCDGDTLLVVADKTIIEVAERNMEGIVPLYYEMKKAEPTILTNEKFYEGMTAAWTGGNIGEISNDITKIWNNDNGIGEDELLAIKLYCMENNYTIFDCRLV